MLIGGIGALASSFQPTITGGDITIPSGKDSYIGYEFPLLGGGRASGSFEVVTGGTVGVMVMTDAQYRVFASGGSPPDTLRSALGSSGQFNVPLPGWDTFHVVIVHDIGYEATQQDVRILITVSGIGPPSYVIGGIVALGLGILFIGLGAWKERRDRRAPRPTFTPMQPNVPFYPPPSWGPPPQPFVPPVQPPTPPDQGPPGPPPG